MAITLHEFEMKQQNSLHLIADKFYPHIDKFKFALFCAKDCFHLNNDYTKPIAKNCIQLVESWLVDPTQVTKQQLKDAIIYSNAAAVNAAAVNAAAVNAAAVNAAFAARDYTDSASHAATAALYAAYAFFYANPNDNKIHQQKLNQYRNYAYSLLRSTNITPTHTKGTIPDKATLMALLDELSELSEDLIIHQNNQFTLNHPTNITTNTLPELVNLIWNDASLLHYLEHLYGN